MSQGNRVKEARRGVEKSGQAVIVAAQVEELAKYVERTEDLLNKKLARLGTHIKAIRQVLDDLSGKAG